MKRVPWNSVGMSLAEQVRFGQVYAPPWVANDGLLQLDSRSLASFRAKLDEAELIEASELCEFFYAGTDQEEWSIERDFPKLAPPFPVFWIEMKKPSRIVDRVTGAQSSDGLPDRMGFLFQRATIEQGKKLLREINVPVSEEMEVALNRWLSSKRRSGESGRNTAQQLGNTSPTPNVLLRCSLDITGRRNDWTRS